MGASVLPTVAEAAAAAGARHVIVVGGDGRQGRKVPPGAEHHPVRRTGDVRGQRSAEAAVRARGSGAVVVVVVSFVNRQAVDALRKAAAEAGASLVYARA